MVKGAENLPNKFVKKLIEEIKTAHLGLKKRENQTKIGKTSENQRFVGFVKKNLKKKEIN